MLLVPFITRTVAEMLTQMIVCLSVQLPFELLVQILVQLLLELEAILLDQNMNEVEFELSRMKRPYVSFG